MENGISFKTPQESFIELKGQLYWENVTLSAVCNN